jgi:hypothetical protein
MGLCDDHREDQMIEAAEGEKPMGRTPSPVRVVI